MAVSNIHWGFGFRQNGGRENNADISIYYAGTEVIRTTASLTSLLQNVTMSGTLVVTGAQTFTGVATFADVVSLDDTTDSTSVTTGSLHTDGGMGVTLDTFFGTHTTWVTSADSVAVADQVAIGRYEIGATNTVLAISQETAVVTEVDETKFSHKFQVRVNGATFFIMMTAT